MRAKNCFAVMAAHDTGTPGGTVQGPPDRVYAGRTNVKGAVRVQARVSRNSSFLL